MAENKGRSEERTDIFGNKITQHFDEKGNKDGWSEERTGLFGDKYVQHHDQSGNKTGRSEHKAGLLGDDYTQHYDQSGSKTGRSEERSGIFGEGYTQHYEQGGQKAGWSEEREGFLGDRYTQHFDRPPPGVPVREAPASPRNAGSAAETHSQRNGPTGAATASRTVHAAPSRKRSAGSRVGTLLGVLYWGAVAAFWCWYLYLSIHNKSPEQEMLKALAPLWSPTGDPVLNFLIDTILVIAGLALAVGVIVGGLVLVALLVAIGIVGAVASLLLVLAQVSVTGTILACVIGGAILYFTGRALSRRLARKR